MPVAILRSILCGLCLVVLPVSTACAQAPLNWAEQMFEEHRHDFGDVARGADVVYRVKFKNIYQQPVHVATVGSSCGCTTPKILNVSNPASKDFFKPGEEGVLELTLDTIKHQRKKEAKVSITFDQPNVANITFPVSAYIRTDVVIEPGSINFGSVELGGGATRKASIKYAGRAGWTITSARGTSNDITVNLGQPVRNGGNVSYELEVALKPGAPAGQFRSQVLLTTDDVNAQPIPVLVEARVEADITVTPDVYALGAMAPGQTKSFNIVVKGKKPFAIDKLECDNGGNDFKVRIPQGEKQVHVVPLTVTAPEKPGAISEIFTLTIAGRTQPVTFKAYGTIGTSPN